jgi:hypothetical protein
MGVMIMGGEILPDVAMPSRADVETSWLGLINGRAARHVVHEWAAKWVEHEEDRPISDVMILKGLQYLHGFDLVRVPGKPGTLRHASNGDYLQSDEGIAQDLDRWRQDCEVYDADPEEYMRVARRRAREYIDLQQNENP